MSDATVRDILEKIEQLSDQDRLNLSMRLAEQTESEWQTETDEARRVARDKGITQTVIDRAVDEIRREK